MSEIKKDNAGKYVGAALLVAGAVGFFGLDGIGKIKNLFSSEPDATEQATTSISDVKPETQTLKVESKEPDSAELNNVVFTADSPQTQKQERQKVKGDILILTKSSSGLSSDRKELPKSTEAVQVRKPQFVRPHDKANPKEFNQRKFGINEAALQEALTQKTALTTKQKLLIEAEKARTVFDSRSISNF